MKVDATTEPPPALPVSLPLGRLLGMLRVASGRTQRAFSLELGFGKGTIAWIESGRSTPSAVQLWSIEKRLIALGVVDRPGRITELFECVTTAMALRGWVLGDGRLRGSVPPVELAEIDRIVAAALQRWIESPKTSVATSAPPNSATRSRSTRRSR